MSFVDVSLQHGAILTSPFHLTCVKLSIFFSFFQDGEIHPVSVKVGEKVLLPEYGGTKIVLEDKVCFPLL